MSLKIYINLVLFYLMNYKYILRIKMFSFNNNIKIWSFLLNFSIVFKNNVKYFENRKNDLKNQIVKISYLQKI